MTWDTQAFHVIGKFAGNLWVFLVALQSVSHTTSMNFNRSMVDVDFIRTLIWGACGQLKAWQELLHHSTSRSKLFSDFVLVKAMSDSKKQDPFLRHTWSSKCWLRSISSLIHLIVSRRATGSGMTVSYQSLRHIQPLWPVSLVGLTPCRTNHRTIKAEYLGVQNKIVQRQSRFSGA